jgi:hypothetical protein
MEPVRSIGEAIIFLRSRRVEIRGIRGVRFDLQFIGKSAMIRDAGTSEENQHVTIAKRDEQRWQSDHDADDHDGAQVVRLGELRQAVPEAHGQKRSDDRKGRQTANLRQAVVSMCAHEWYSPWIGEYWRRSHEISAESAPTHALAAACNVARAIG